jgi:hypothetical protein
MQSGLDILKNMLGNPQQKQDYQDFIRRYDQGHPSEGYSDQEALQRYRDVTNQLPADQYQQSAEEAFSRLSPQERSEFGNWLRSRAQQQNVPFPDVDRNGQDDRLQDPRELARATTQMREQDPDMLTKVLTGKTGTALDNPLARAALAGVAAMAAKRILTGR